MNSPYLSSPTPLTPSSDWRAMLDRLIGNLSGFLYRRRLDARWTMEFVSAGCRDITGYDQHRFIGNASIAYGDLVARAEWRRVNERVRLAALQRRHATIEYSIRTARGAWLRVEDRFTPIVDAAGQVLVIEGIIDRADRSHDLSSRSLPDADEARLAAHCTSPASN